MPDWPLPPERVGRIARHYAEEVPWFASDLEQDEEARMNLRGAFRDFLSIAEALDELDVSGAPIPAVEWLDQWPGNRDPWADAVGYAEACLNSKVWSLIEIIDRSTGQEPLFGEPGVAEHERLLWPEGSTTARPSVDPLFRDGILTEEWRDFLGALAAGFRSLADEMCEMHEEVMVARSLLFRGFFLCMDLVYAGRALDYAWHLHATERDVPDLTDEDLLDALSQGTDALRTVVRFLDLENRTRHLQGDPYLRGAGIARSNRVVVRPNEEGDWAVFAGALQVYAADAARAEDLRMTPRELAEGFADELRRAAGRHPDLLNGLTEGSDGGR
ncbi:MAG: hypothetical protein ACOX9R_11440 [Armatimonadota bacterium]|jgi:hypothetical protein